MVQNEKQGTFSRPSFSCKEKFISRIFLNPPVQLKLKAFVFVKNTLVM